LLTNPVLISVLLMSILCLLKINIIIAIISGAIVAGLIAGIPVVGDYSSMGILIDGMGGNAQTALSYILLGALAYGVQSSGLAGMISKIMHKSFGKNTSVLLLVLAGITCFSQNLIPIHIAFIPILIPTLLNMMNEMKLDRRAAACALTFGLKMPYLFIPAGFGLIFHTIIAEQTVWLFPQVKYGNTCLFPL
jgi:putative amino acid transporter